MAYVTQATIQTSIPSSILTNALDDDADGSADSGLLDSIIASADNAVDALLASRYAVPFSEPYPALVVEASRIFTLERIYERRPTGEKNPLKTDADAMRERLEKIAKGDASLDSTLDAARTPGEAVTSDACIADESMA